MQYWLGSTQDNENRSDGDRRLSPRIKRPHFASGEFWIWDKAPATLITHDQPMANPLQQNLMAVGAADLTNVIAANPAQSLEFSFLHTKKPSSPASRM